LLKYTTHIPVDKAFYEAGRDKHAQNEIYMAFYYYNRYLDILDAIQDESAQLDNTDFQDTDLPFDVALPAQGFATEDENEEIRELVLGWSVSSSIAQRMEERSCENCGKNIYGAALSCRHCGFQSAPCVVTGQPVLRASRVDCSNCKSQANRDDWNVYINKFGSCPWCRARQKVSTSFVLGA